MTERANVRLRGPLAPYASGFREELVRQGYTKRPAVAQVLLMAHLSRWLEDGGVDAEGLTPERVERFLQARRREGHARLLGQRGLAPLLGHLRALGVVPEPEPPVATTPAAELLGRYRLYLVRERGLADRVVAHYEHAARLFLADRPGASSLDLAALTAADIVGFLARECPRRGVGSAQNLASALRSFLRFMHLEGWTQLPLAQAVAPVAGWRGGPLPRALAPGQAVRLLASCDRRTGIGRRDYAILTLLARLGLRAGEVAGLTLDDVDWRAGEILVRGKGRRQERLPLPADVGEALAGYLREGRPRSDSRALFLRCRAPIGVLGPTGVSWVVRAACERAGLPHVGAHRLRHTAATEMLRAGAPLSEIAQVLRHRSTATTAIYAKVDHGALGTLAQPWPGGAA